MILIFPYKPYLPPLNVDSPAHLDLGTVEEKVGGESLRGFSTALIVGIVDQVDVPAAPEGARA